MLDILIHLSLITTLQSSYCYIHILYVEVGSLIQGYLFNKGENYVLNFTDLAPYLVIFLRLSPVILKWTESYNALD